jgi:hypothetical protein
MNFQNINSLWLNIAKDSSGVWSYLGKPLTEFASDWDVGEPVSAAGADCAAMVQSSG